ESSRVQAAAVFFPPTDFLNFGEPGREVPTSRPPFAGAFDFREYSQEQGRLLPVTDAEERRDIVRRISPAQHVTGDSAPALLVHGDRDVVVPLQQSELMVAKLREAGVPAELIVKKGRGHGWLTILDDVGPMVDWFDRHLARKPEK